MIAGLPLGFAEPLVLIGLLTLPALWWLLRLVPPRPRRIDFPPTRLLMDIAPRDETPARTPWWLTLLRLLLAALGRGKISGSTAALFRASPPQESIGAARPAMTTIMYASRNGRPRIPSGSGPIVHRR